LTIHPSIHPSIHPFFKRRSHYFLSPARFLHPRIPGTCNASHWTTSSHLVLVFPFDLTPRIIFGDQFKSWNWRNCKDTFEVNFGTPNEIGRLSLPSTKFSIYYSRIIWSFGDIRCGLLKDSSNRK
jgi:hypothetical protein